MAEKVFHDKERLALLNGIIHPKVKAYIRQYIDDRKDQEGVLVLENAILFETGCDAFCDEIWYIAVSADARKNVCVKTEDIRMKKPGNYGKTAK